MNTNLIKQHKISVPSLDGTHILTTDSLQIGKLKQTHHINQVWAGINGVYWLTLWVVHWHNRLWRTSCMTPMYIARPPLILSLHSHTHLPRECHQHTQKPTYTFMYPCTYLSSYILCTCTALVHAHVCDQEDHLALSSLIHQVLVSRDFKIASVISVCHVPIFWPIFCGEHFISFVFVSLVQSEAVVVSLQSELPILQ